LSWVIKLSLSFFWQSVGTSRYAHRQEKVQCPPDIPPFVARRKNDITPLEPILAGILHWDGSIAPQYYPSHLLMV